VVFGVAKDSADAWHALKRGYWEYHTVHAYCCTAGKPVSERLKRLMEEKLGDLRTFENPEWYDMTAAEAITHLEAVAKSQRVELFDIIEKARRIERHAGKMGNAKHLSAFENPRRLHPLRIVKE